VSTVPSAFSRAAYLRRVNVAAPLGCSVVNVPPITTLPSAWRAETSTLPFAFGL